MELSESEMHALRRLALLDSGWAEDPATGELIHPSDPRWFNGNIQDVDGSGIVRPVGPKDSHPDNPPRPVGPRRRAARIGLGVVAGTVIAGSGAAAGGVFRRFGK